MMLQTLFTCVFHKALQISKVFPVGFSHAFFSLTNYGSFQEANTFDHIASGLAFDFQFDHLKLCLGI